MCKMRKLYGQLCRWRDLYRVGRMDIYGHYDN